MCMGRNLGKVALKKYQAKGKNGYIKVYKSVFRYRYKKHYSALVFPKRYDGGLHHARQTARYEDQLIHAFRDKRSAKKWGQMVVECLVKPAWIVAVGSDCPEKTLTTKAIVMPEFPRTKVTVKEFRAAVKGKKVKTYSWEK